MGKKVLIVSPLLQANLAKIIPHLRQQARAGRNMSKLLVEVTNNPGFANRQKKKQKECYYLANYISNIVKRMSKKDE